MKDQVTVAAVAFDGRPGEVEANLERMDGWCRCAAAEGAELVLFPELSVTGFLPNHPVGPHEPWIAQVLQGAWRMAQRLDGPVVEALRRMSRETGVCVSAGFLENSGNALFNTHVLAGDGELLGSWRKMHIPLFEMQVYNGGGIPETVETDLGRVGVNICFDAFLPESTRLLGVRNAEIVLFPFAADPPPGTAAGWADWARPVLQARCAENGVFGVACNYFGEVSYAEAGQRFPGGAMVVGPDGGEQASNTEPSREPHMLTAVLRRDDLLAARARFEYTFRFRRPELYGPLAGNS
jgi:N-carbamoylputrescine amidase